MRTKMLTALALCLAATGAFAAPQSHGHGGMGHAGMNSDSHGDTVSAMTNATRTSDSKVGPAVSDVAQDKAKGKGVTGTAHGKTHSKTHGKH